ncbi:GlsB/YeaQ/YmgE family stress response membrane protein [Sphaerotilus sp.]|uniref:GlsB/YeaQ/YmgE family stress response membrane protein n=1 Tax=Sphaerotilus sp. TaxID=2093942 RepID=UPI002ACEC9F7|nr:GlsB/YeaQ/YmgE family stress response membrane protein [Sphaerotilus sp.]MDZ7854613.1 GlsB/YeaQ/YmgE family stress response membrane protein [Sphaerotilus sp.]
MSFVWMVIVGFLIGLVARWIIPGTQALGFILTTLLGIAGSFVAGFAGQMLGLYAQGQPVGYIASVIGAAVLLFVVGKLKGA